MNSNLKNNTQMANNSFIPKNRAERRALAKRLKITPQKLNELLQVQIENIAIDYLPNGQKVRLKADKILERKSELSEKFIQFIEENKDNILTVERDPEKDDEAQVVCLKEDPNEVKWLFHYADLELVLNED